MNKYLPFILLILIIGCGPTQSRIKVFDHELFSLHYPENWDRREIDELVFVVAKYSETEKLIMGSSPSLIVAMDDATKYVIDGKMDIEDYLKGYEDAFTRRNDAVLIDSLKTIELNNHKVYRVQFKIQGQQYTFLQSQYFFYNVGYYISIFATHEFDKPEPDLTKMLESLKIKEYEPIEKLLLDLTDSVLVL